MSNNVNCKDISLNSVTSNLLSTINFKDFQPNFLLHLLFTISKEQVNLKVSTSKYACFISLENGWCITYHEIVPSFWPASIVPSILQLNQSRYAVCYSSASEKKQKRLKHSYLPIETFIHPIHIFSKELYSLSNAWFENQGNISIVRNCVTTGCVSSAD